MAINNPYIPGDPYSYDLKWIIRRLKELGLSIEAIQTIVEELAENQQTFSMKNAFVYNVRDYGAVGDQVTNDTDAINACYTKAKETGGIIYFPPGEYLTSEPIQFDDNGVNIYMEGTIYYPLRDAAIIVGSIDHANTGMKAVLKAEGAGYTTTDSIGIELLNLNACTIDILRSVNFETGVHVVGNTRGTQNNVITLGEITKTKDGLVLEAVDGGYCNENLFLGGRFTKFSSVGVTTSGITITSNNAYYNNNNVFIKPNIENCDVGLNVEYGKCNHFYDARFESVGTSMIFSNDSQNNNVTCGDSDASSITGGGVNTIIQARRRTQMRKEMMTLALDSFSTNAACNATNGVVKDVLYFNTTALTFVPVIGRFVYTLDGDYIVLPSGNMYGIMLDVNTDGNDIFYFNAIQKGNTSRGVVYMFDENGSPITTVPDAFIEAPGASYTSHNATMTRFSASTAGYAFVIPAACKKMFVGVETTASTSIKSFIAKTTAQISLQTHDLALPDIPTSAGAYNGQIVRDTTGTHIWTWNGTTWSVTV